MGVDRGAGGRPRQPRQHMVFVYNTYNQYHSYDMVTIPYHSMVDDRVLWYGTNITIRVNQQKNTELGASTVTTHRAPNINLFLPNVTVRWFV